MRLSVLVAIGALALFTLPGFADQFGKGPSLDSQLLRLAGAQAGLGTTLDPNAAPQLRIVLPTNRGGFAPLLGGF